MKGQDSAISGRAAARRAYAGSVACLAFVLAGAGCSHQSSANASTAVVKVEQAPDSSLVEVQHPEQFRLVKVEARSTADQLVVNGVVAPDVSRTVHVNALSEGRVIEVRARLGDDVRRGQVLMVVSSPELASAIADFRKAQADEQLARQGLDRTRALYEHGAAPQKDLQEAEDAENNAKVNFDTAATQIRILGGDLSNLSPVIQVKSPIGGTIVEQNTAGGEAVRPLDSSPSLFTVANLSCVWVVSDVYENNLADVHLGDIAEVRLNAYPDLPLSGRVTNISRVLDPNTRTAKVRVDLGNRRGLLRPGMFATVKFITRRTRERLFLPASALLRLHDKYWVFLPAGGRQFRRTEVETGPISTEGLQEVRSGLNRGDQVVAEALEFSSSVEEQ